MGIFYDRISSLILRAKPFFIINIPFGGKTKTVSFNVMYSLAFSLSLLYTRMYVYTLIYTLNFNILIRIQIRIFNLNFYHLLRTCNAEVLRNIISSKII